MSGIHRSTRLLSVGLVAVMVLSSFAGLILVAKSVSAVTGDMNVTGPFTIEDTVFTIDGTLTVGATGTLTIRNAELRFVSDGSNPHSLIVNGGKLILDGGTVTTYLDQVSSHPFLTMSIQNGANVRASNDSVLRFPGTLAITGATTKVNLSDTNITHLDLAMVDTYYSPILTDADYGPAITITDATVEMYDSRIDSLPELGGADNNLTLAGSAQFTAVNSYIDVDYLDLTSSDHNKILLQNNARAYLYGCRFDMAGTPPYSSSAVIFGGATCEAYLYRWADVTLNDKYGVPLQGATISAKFTGSTFLEGKDAYYYVPPAGATQTTPPGMILNYMGKTAANYRTANSAGKVLVPYLTDIINWTTAPNSLYVGLYKLTGTYTTYSTTVEFGLDTYPLMGASNAMSSTSIDIANAVAPSNPDPTKYLIVPPNMALSGAYAHTGDVIIKSGGTLTLNDCDFYIYKTDGVPARIIIDTGGKLVLNNLSSISGNVPLSIEVRTGSSLSSYASDIAANISIYGTAQVRMSGSLSGSFTTSADASASIVFSDMNLTSAPVIDGSSTVNVWNTSAPKISLQGNAKMNLYRWATVTILDGTNYVLPGASVRAYWQLNSTLHTTAMASSNGIAKVKLLTNELTATNGVVSSKYLGNYKLVAVHTYNSVDYSSSPGYVALAPYSEPLIAANIAGTFKIESALPNIDPPVTVYRNPAVANAPATVTTVISNTGVVDARDVLVYFYDSDDTVPAMSEKFAEYTVDLIPAGGQATVNVTWMNTHAPGETRYIIVQVDPLDTIPEMNEDDNIGWEMVPVIGLPDLEIGPGGIYSAPTLPTEGISCDLYAQIINVGDASAGTFGVSFYYDQVDGAHLIGTATIGPLGVGAVTLAHVTWASPVAGLKPIIVSINPSHALEERDYSNNNGTGVITVLTQPDLYISSMFAVHKGVQVSSSDNLPAGEQVSIYVLVHNAGGTVVTGPTMVALYMGSISPSNMVKYVNITTPISVSNPYTQVVFDIVLPEQTVPIADYTFFAVVNPTVGQGGFSPVFESDYTNNANNIALRAFDSRPDPAISMDDIRVLVGGVSLSSVGGNVSYGDNIEVLLTIRNDGYLPVQSLSVSLNITGNDSYTQSIDTPIKVEYINVSGYSETEISITYKVSVKYSGNYRFAVWLDIEQTVKDKDRSNNFAYADVKVLYIMPTISIFANGNVTAGTSLTISGYVKYPDGSAWGGIDVWIVVKNAVDANVTTPVKVVTNTDGRYTTTITIPASLSPSPPFYKIDVSVGKDHEQKPLGIQAASVLELWMIILIAAAVIAALVIFSIYIYKRGVGKLVECGECGALIPESASKCPKCGVEFEKDMVKCSECGAWIPASSVECPNCHVRFGTPLEGEKSYEDKMRDQYEENVLSKYRDLAKAELGKDYNEDTFKAWWETNPAYISFEDWLAKEEERRKQANLVACPVCGTPNAKDATVCHGCGSQLTPVQVETTTTPEGVVIEKRVIRRPIEKKVVSKKVIKKPLDQEQQQGGGQQQQ
ncbi:MAG: CARDB domain-containing protein [Thermoplasmata archaeon]